MEEQENEYVAPRPIAMKYGAIAGVVSIILFVIADFANMQQDPIITGVSFAISIILIFLAHREYKNEGDGFMDYGQGVGIGFWYGLISSVISSIFSYIYVTMINPTYMDIIKEQQIMSMEEQGLTDAQIEQAMEMSSAFSGPLAILIFGLILGPLFSVIIALIVSAFTKKSRPELD